jgi:MurNAc alpha-1-phosphate uridylyltransferase
MLPCVILAGGIGKRMRPLTANMPKALIPVLGRPFAELQLERLAAQGVRDVVYSIGYRGEMIRETLGDGARYGLRIVFVDEGQRLRGTAGALRLALDEGLLPEAFFLLNGDSYLSLNLADVEAAWRTRGRVVLMTVLRNEGRWDRSNVSLRSDGSVLYDKRLAAQDGRLFEWIDYGLSIVTHEAIENSIPPSGVGDWADVVHALSVRDAVAGYEVGERFYEVGSPEGLRDLEEHLLASAQNVNPRRIFFD